MTAAEAFPRPLFPPLLQGRAAVPPVTPWDAALDGAAAGSLGAGDLIHGIGDETLSLALVLEPEVGRAACAQIQTLAMVAFGDAAGAVIPSENAITYTWPGGLRLNGGLVGHCRLAAGPGDPPGWLVVGLSVRLAALPMADPGETPDRTSFADEGCGGVGAVDLLESLGRHLVHGLHRWESDGFGPFHRDWWDRRDTAATLAQGIEGRLIGIDENGNAVLDGPRKGLALWDAPAP